MASFNKIIIVGYLGRDPELKQTPSGNPVCRFTVATTERRKRSDGETEDQTTWFRVTCWGQIAEFIGGNLSKGHQVYVEGRLHLENYLDREGGQRSSLEVNASAAYSLTNLGEATRTEAASQPKMKAETAATEKALLLNTNKKRNQPVEEDDIPF